jgi:hypothetical protein
MSNTLNRTKEINRKYQISSSLKKFQQAGLFDWGHLDAEEFYVDAASTNA